MLNKFRKKPLRNSFFPRAKRIPLEGEVYIKRVGQITLRANQGNISAGGLYVVIPGHDLERGKRVEIVIVTKNGSLRNMTRMMGIVIRIEPQGAAMVTYKKQELDSASEMQHEERVLKQEFDHI